METRQNIAKSTLYLIIILSSGNIYISGEGKEVNLNHGTYKLNGLESNKMSGNGGIPCSYLSMADVLAGAYIKVSGT